MIASNQASRGVRGFGGVAPLEGTNLVRLTYLDEAGISDGEPCAVVSGVMVDGDRQLRKVEEALAELVAKHIPKRDADGFVFQAKHLWSGVKYFKDRTVWPLSKRLEILADLAGIPEKFGLPVTSGVSRKEYVRSILDEPIHDRNLDAVCHSLAYTGALQLVERVLIHSLPTEYTIIIAEDRPAVKKMIKRVHLSLQRPEKLPPEILSRFYELPFKHIRDTVMFADKKDSPTLQVADTCSFILRGVSSGHPKIGPFLEILRPALIEHDDFLGATETKP